MARRRSWKLVGEISAGNYSEFKLDEVTTINIMTGGKIPKGCTAVIPIEDVFAKDQNIQLLEGKKIFKGMNIRKKEKANNYFFQKFEIISSMI